MPIVGPVQRLMGNEAPGRGVRHREVDELGAVQAYEAVGAGDEEDDHHRTDERPLTGWHRGRVPHSRVAGTTIC